MKQLLKNLLAGRNGGIDPAAHLRHACQAAGRLSVSKDLRQVRVICLLHLGPFFLSFGFLLVQTLLDTFRASGMLACPPDANQTFPFLTLDPVEDGLPGWGLQFTIWNKIELVLHEEIGKAAMVDPFLIFWTSLNSTNWVPHDPLAVIIHLTRILISYRILYKSISISPSSEVDDYCCVPSAKGSATYSCRNAKKLSTDCSAGRLRSWRVLLPSTGASLAPDCTAVHSLRRKFRETAVRMQKA